MSIDMDEEATPANTSTTLGTREACARINENNSLDADEDVVDGLIIDVTATNIPAFNNNGTPLNLNDDTGGVIAYVFDFGYSSADLTVQAGQANTPGVNILQENPGGSFINLSDPTPDDNTNDVWAGLGLDTGIGVPEEGSGVLHRLTLVTEDDVTIGNYPLTLTNNVHSDAALSAYFPDTTSDAYVAVNTTCGDSDGDGVPDAQDACPTYVGLASNNGCPLPGPPAVGGKAGLLRSDTGIATDSGEARNGWSDDRTLVAGVVGGIALLSTLRAWSALAAIARIVSGVNRPSRR